MQLKKSLFNKTLYLKNMTRFAPIWASFLVFQLLEVPTAFLVQIHNYGYYDSVSERAVAYTYRFCNLVQSASFPMLYIFYALSVSIGCFAYLYRTRSAYMMHAFPVSRKEMYVTNLTSGLSMLWIPELLVFIVTLPCMLSNGVKCTGILVAWLLYVMGYSLLFFAIGTFVCLVTGNIIATPFLYFFCLVGVDAIRFISSLFSTYFVYGKGVTGVRASVFSPGLASFSYTGIDVYYSENVERLQDSWYQVATNMNTFYTKGEKILIGYAIFALLLLVASWFVYRFRHIEAAGEVVAYSWLRPCFRWAVGYCFGVGLAIIFIEFFFYDKVVKSFVGVMGTALAFGLIAFLLAQMILKKSPHIFTRRFLSEMVAFAAVLIVLFGAVRLDISGFEKNIPDSDTIVSASFNCDGVITTQNPEMIERIRAIHTRALEEKAVLWEKLRANPDEHYSFNIDYTLTDGSVVSRTYYMPTAEAEINDMTSLYNDVLKLENTPEFILDYLFDNDGLPMTIDGGYVDAVHFRSDDYYWESKDLTQQQAQQIYDAVVLDIAAGNLPQFLNNYDEVYGNSLELRYMVKTATKTGIAFDYRNSAYIRLTPKATNTIAALLEMGLLTEDELKTNAELDEFWEKVNTNI